MAFGRFLPSYGSSQGLAETGLNHRFPAGEKALDRDK